MPLTAQFCFIPSAVDTGCLRGYGRPGTKIGEGRGSATIGPPIDTGDVGVAMLREEHQESSGRIRGRPSSYSRDGVTQLFFVVPCFAKTTITKREFETYYVDDLYPGMALRSFTPSLESVIATPVVAQAVDGREDHHHQARTRTRGVFSDDLYPGCRYAALSFHKIQ